MKIIEDVFWPYDVVTINRKKYDVYNFVRDAIEAGTIKALAELYGCSWATIDRAIKKYFPDLPLAGTKLSLRFLHGLGQKKCAKCGEVLDYEHFTKDRSTKDGLDRYCKYCRLEYYNEVMYNPTDPIPNEKYWDKLYTEMPEQSTKDRYLRHRKLGYHNYDPEIVITSDLGSQYSDVKV